MNYGDYMKEPIEKIITNILKSIYQPFLFAIVISFLIVFVSMYLEKYQGMEWKAQLKRALLDWKTKFVRSKKTRRIFYFSFITTLILFKTLFSREMWLNPLTDVLGVWGLYKKNGQFTTEIFENILLFIPFVLFFFLFLETTTKRTFRFLKIIGESIVVSFVFSLAIETLQLFLRLGTWQLSDLCFNTLGGVVGGLLYWISVKIRRKKL